MSLNIVEKSKDHSDKLTWGIQLLFGLVITQGLLINRDLVIAPQSGSMLRWIVLIVIMSTTIMSWVGFSFVTLSNPYMLRRSYIEYCRYFSDILIVIIYAYAIYATNITNERSSVDNLLTALPIIFLLYIASGYLRRKTYGPRASNLFDLSAYFIIFTIIKLLSMVGTYDHTSLLVYVFGAGIIMITYRMSPIHKVIKSISFSKRLKIGVDIDGVLANQITGLLPAINAKYKLDIKYGDIKDWRQPISETSIDKLIINAQANDIRYVLGMPTTRNAKRMFRKLMSIRGDTISVVTARSENCREITEQWLLNNGLVPDDYISSSEARKGEHGLDILIDDYTGNIKQFLEKQNTFAILYKQPWNANIGTDFDVHINANRL
jgi:5'(3')-deoxyribonucleotidase